MLESERFALAALLHVVLRRTTGRVTDTEWLAKNSEYATEIVRFAKISGKDLGHQELLALAEKYEEAMGLATQGKEIRRSIFGAAREGSSDAVPVSMTSSGRYVGGLR